MIVKIYNNNYYKLVIYVLIIALLLMLYLGSTNLIEGNTCMNDMSSSGLLNIISCTNDNNNNPNNLNNTTFTDISSVCTNNREKTVTNIVRSGGLGNQASNLYNSTGQLLSNAANASGLC